MKIMLKNKIAKYFELLYPDYEIVSFSLHTNGARAILIYMTEERLCCSSYYENEYSETEELAKKIYLFALQDQHKIHIKRNKRNKRLQLNFDYGSCNEIRNKLLFKLCKRQKDKSLNERELRQCEV